MAQDIKAFENLFNKHYTGLVVYATQFTKDSDAAEDIVCEHCPFHVFDSLLLNETGSVCHCYAGLVREVSIPDTVVELLKACFCWCKSLQRVTFTAYSKLERICAKAFHGTGLESFSVPDSVVELGEMCFYHCESLRRVTFGASSNVERICASASSMTSFESLSIPDSVVEIGARCFSYSQRLRSITFGPSSNLERIGADAFYSTSNDCVQEGQRFTGSPMYIVYAQGGQCTSLELRVGGALQEFRWCQFHTTFVSFVIVASKGARVFVA